MRVSKDVKQILSTLQFLHHVAYRGGDLADDLDPNRTFNTEQPYGSFESVGHGCNALYRKASEIFRELSGLNTYDTELHELSTEDPSPRVLKALESRPGKAAERSRETTAHPGDR